MQICNSEQDLHRLTSFSDNYGIDVDYITSINISLNEYKCMCLVSSKLEVGPMTQW
jgi:hypothetical protein